MMIGPLPHNGTVAGENFPVELCFRRKLGHFGIWGQVGGLIQ